MKMYPHCTGPCSYSWPRGVSDALHAQLAGFQSIEQVISDRRMQSLTADEMRREALILQSRIDRLRVRRNNGGFLPNGT